MLESIKKFFKGTTQQERYNEKCKEVAEAHFGEIIDWNVQTSMYGMLCCLIHNIDEKHLKSIAKSYEEGWNEDIEVQLRDALRDVLKAKGLLNV